MGNEKIDHAQLALPILKKCRYDAVLSLLTLIHNSRGFVSKYKWSGDYWWGYLFSISIFIISHKAKKNSLLLLKRWILSPRPISLNWATNS